MRDGTLPRILRQRAPPAGSCGVPGGDPATGERPLEEPTRAPGLSSAATFESVVLPHLDSAYNVARWLVGDPTLAEDVVQDATIRALRYFASYRGGNPRAWLLRIVRNAAHEARSARQRHAAASLDETDPDRGEARGALDVRDPAEDP